MTEARISRAALAAAKNVGESEYLNDIVIGRDVLELVSSAMYVDPMTVYREYIQNCADAIDEARVAGIIGEGEHGQVSIKIDAASRSILIRDNGIGVANKEFARKMVALGASRKRGTTARGFRGVGRLAGLGYAQELIFRSKTASDTSVAELVWDCRKLKAALRQSEGTIEELIRSVATLRKKAVADYPERFFEVELRNVVRLRSDRLMSPAAVDEYLGQVAPVPFSPEFRFGPDIRAALVEHVGLGELDVRIDGQDQPVYRPHRNVMINESGKSIEFESLSLTEIPGVDGDTAAVAWILHHNYEGALPNEAGVKGLRLRSGNIQIGEHALLEDLFPETRFNAWAVGEVHVVDKKIVPNGRRDHFDQNTHYHNLTNQLSPLAREIARRCRTSSVRRKWQREFELAQTSVREVVGVIAQGSLGSKGRAEIARAAGQTLDKMTKIAEMDILADMAPKYRDAVSTLRENLTAGDSEVGSVAAPLARLPEVERQRFENFFELVYECSTNRVAAKALIDRILLRLE
ncbi:ATP-binding protein (plasmid) [Agrobacterium sp. rho-8.1]|nr:ATP-binding protein [Agrobacterium sp. rho-8.1]